jgi:hypothetical protein
LAAAEPARQEVAAATAAVAAAAAAMQLQRLQLDAQVSEVEQQQQQRQQDCGPADECAALWQPFLQFLQQRRADVLQQLQQEQQRLLQLGTVASEIYARFAGAAAAAAVETSAIAQQQHAPAAAGAVSGICSTVCGKVGAAAAAAFPCIGVGEECLPSWLVQQLPQYIPEDLRSIVCVCAADDGMSRRLPVRLHGDLMAGNLVLQLQQDGAHAVVTEQHQQPCSASKPAGSAAVARGIQQGLCDAVSAAAAAAATVEPRWLQQAGCAEAAGMNTAHMVQQQQQQQQQHGQQQGLQQVSFIDFADGGIGDPLYDFVAVFVSVLDCDMQLLQLALQSYASRLDVAAVWPARQSASCSAPACLPLDCGPAATADAGDRKERTGSGGSSSNSSGWQCGGVSRAFMVHLLLHEEGGILGQLLEKWPQLSACGSLKEMQQQLFAWMDDWWASCVQQGSI